MQLDHFALYDKTSAQAVVTRPCALINMYGNYTGAGGEFLQVFDKATAAVANDVPIISLYLGAGASGSLLPSFFEGLGAHVFTNGISIGVSTVNEKYTASGSSFDIEGDTESMDLPITGLSTATDGVARVSATVWNDAAGPKKLYRLTIVNAEGVTVYPMIFTYTPSVNGELAWKTLDGVADGTTRMFDFGENGVQPIDKPRMLLGVDDSLVRKACYIKLSDLATALDDATLIAAAGTSITAYYKTL